MRDREEKKGKKMHKWMEGERESLKNCGEVRDGENGRHPDGKWTE